MKYKEMCELMGKIVTVRKIYVRRHNGKERSWEEKEIQPRAGWVVGIRTIHDGIYSPGGGAYGYEGEYESDAPSLKITATKNCLLVTFWPTKKPVNIPVDAVEIGGTPTPPLVKWNDKDKEFLREEMIKWPRAKDGKWEKASSRKNNLPPDKIV